MAVSYPPSMRRLVNELSKLPSIGEKSAIRLAYHLTVRDPEEAKKLADAIRDACEHTRLCSVCFGITEDERCAICADAARDRLTICVVEKPSDVFALERSGGYRGVYHVLHGLWSPLRGLGPESTKLGALLGRLELSAQEGEDKKVREVVLATGATVEGDATALYIAKAVAAMNISVTRIAQGLPKGGELEYADELTLSHALEGRRSIG